MAKVQWFVLLVLVALLSACGNKKPVELPAPIVVVTSPPVTPFVLENRCGDLSAMSLPMEEPKNGEFLTVNSSNTGGIISDRIRTVTLSHGIILMGFFEDTQRGYTVATYDGKTVQPCGYKQGVLPHGQVNAIAVDDQDRAWIGTDGQGIFVFDNTWHAITRTASVDLSDNRIYDLVPQPGGMIAATWEGISSYADFTGKFNSRPDWQEPNTGPYHVHSFLTVSHYLLMGTINGGLVVGNFSPSGPTEWKHFTSDDSEMPSDNVRDLSLDPANANVWVAMDGGLIVYDPAEDSWQRQLPPNNRVMAVGFDMYKRPWIATLGGVYYMDGDQWRHYYSDYPTLGLAFSANNYVVIATDGNGVVIGKVPRPPL